MNTTKKLNALFAKKGCTQSEMSDFVGVSRPTVSQWLNGKNVPQGRNLAAIAEYFGVPVSALTEDSSASAAQGAHNARTPANALQSARDEVELLELQLRAAELRAKLATIQAAPRQPFAVLDGPGASPPVFAARPQPEAAPKHVDEAPKKKRNGA